VAPLSFRTEQYRSASPHVYAVYGPDSDADWLDRLADAYVALRSTCRTPLPESVLDGIDVVDRATVHRYLARATVPRLTSAGPLDIVRADLGEMLAYELLEGEYRTGIGYKLVRDREAVKLPGRGIDAIGAEHPTPGASSAGAASGGSAPPERLVANQSRPSADAPSNDDGMQLPVLVLAEVKVSDEVASPPQVVDRKRDSMRNQHRGHIKEKRHTTDKVWLAVRNATDVDVQQRLTQIALQLERDVSGVTIVACCVLVRPAARVCETDCGSFATRPPDFRPAHIRFLTVALPADMSTTLTDWDAAIARAIERHCDGAEGAAA
jgi:hypothetical protein